MTNRSKNDSDGCRRSSWVSGRLLKLGLVAMVVLGAACGDGDQFGRNSSSSALCSDSCRFAFDGACDDGGSGSSYSECQYGSDCGDCGPRDPQEYNCCNDYRFFEDEMACMSGLKECP